VFGHVHVRIATESRDHVLPIVMKETNRHTVRANDTSPLTSGILPRVEFGDRPNDGMPRCIRKKNSFVGKIDTR
jgi:hypothetical protein